MLSYERRHLPYFTWFHKRPSGENARSSGSEFCILLTTDTGANDKEALLTTDTGTLTECAQLTTTEN